METSSKSSVPQWSKVALAIGIGTPVALGIAYWYVKKYRRGKRRGSQLYTDIIESPSEETKKITDKTKSSNKLGSLSENGKLLSDDPYEKAIAFKNRGNALFKEGSFDKAVECYTNAIEVCPPDKKSDIATFYQNRAAAYELLKNYSEVIKDCTKSLEFNSKYMKALQRRARAYDAVGDLEHCLEDSTKQCLMEGFANPNTLKMTDKVLKQLSKDKAKELYKNREISLPSKHFIRHYFISFSEDPIMKSVEEYKKNMDNINPSDLSGFRLVIHNLAEENYADVISNCTVEIDRQGTDMPEALLVRATFLLIQGQIEEARADLLRLLDLESVDIKVRVNALIKMGTLKVQLDQIEAAIEDFDKAVELDLNNADIYLHRGQVALLSDRIDDALRDMDKSISLNPNFPSAIAQKCYIQYRCGLQYNDETQKSQALKGFAEVIENFPNCPESYYLYAQVLTECIEYDKAEKYFLKAGELDPEDPNVFVHRGLLLLQWKQDIDGALALFNKALEMDEKCQFACETLGSLEVQRGNYQRGMELFQKAIELSQSENDLIHLVSLLKAAEAQAKATESLGLPMGNFQNSGS